jgi:hypothetical protein
VEGTTERDIVLFKDQTPGTKGKERFDAPYRGMIEPSIRIDNDEKGSSVEFFTFLPLD